MRIMIVEDDDISRLILQAAVEQFGHHCLVAEDGAQAWDVSQQSDVDVIISDRLMPHMDGIELCRRIRQSSRQGYTYFIFLTALDDKQQLLGGIEAGADDYLTKPLHQEELQMRLLVAARITGLHRKLAEQQTQLEQLNEQLFVQARRDPLTQLGNRLQLREDLATLTARVERYHQHYCAMMCDVDHFKPYNDYYGHLAGDQILRTIAQLLVHGCRAGDTAYRAGGEEFLLIMPAQSLESAMAAADRIRRAIESLSIEHAGKTPAGVVTISAGIATLEPDAGGDVDAWLQAADVALYRAKAAGRNRVMAFTDAPMPAESVN